MKRFTETTKWSDPWFRKLSPKYKLLWMYLLDCCDIAGIWDADLELAEFQIGEDFYLEEIKQVFADRVTFLNDGKWFLNKFIQFQHGELNPENNCHKGVLKRLSLIDLKENEAPIEPLISPSQGAQVKVKVKVKVKDSEGGCGGISKAQPENFEEVLACGALAGASKDFCEWFWSNYQSNGWIDGGTKLPIYDWKFKLSKLWIEKKAKDNEKTVKSNGSNGYSKQIPVRSQQDILEATEKAREVTANAWKSDPADIAKFIRSGVSGGQLERIKMLSEEQKDYLLLIVSDKSRKEIEEKLTNGHAQRRC